MNISLRISSDGIKDGIRESLCLRVLVVLLEFLDDDDAFFIDGSNEVGVLTVNGILDGLKIPLMVFFLRGFQNIYDSSGIRGNVQLFGTVIDIDKQKVIQKKVLDEIVLVKTLLISRQQTLQLKYSHLSDQEIFIA